MNTIKETYVKERVKQIKEEVEKDGWAHVATCNLFWHGWSEKDYLYMPTIARELEEHGIETRRETRFGVTDYYFS